MYFVLGKGDVTDIYVCVTYGSIHPVYPQFIRLRCTEDPALPSKSVGETENNKTKIETENKIH
jgi:hypothetical protein